MVDVGEEVVVSTTGCEVLDLCQHVLFIYIMTMVCISTVQYIGWCGSNLAWLKGTTT